MLKILHKGNQISLDLDQTSLTGDADVDSRSTYVAGLVGGRVAAVDSNGKAQLADGAEAGGLVPVGFLINDAAGYFYENKPALASGKVAVTFGNCVVTTDQIDTAITIAAGDRLYVGTTSKKGLITNVPPTGAREFGIALTAASAAAPEVTIAVLG